MERLSEQQEKFAQLVADGSNYSDALRQIRPHVKNWKSKSINEVASRLCVKVASRIDELKAELAAKNLWSREDSVNALRSVVDSPDKASDVTGAVKELNSMHGYKEAEEHNHNHSGKVDGKWTVEFINAEITDATPES